MSDNKKTRKNVEDPTSAEDEWTRAVLKGGRLTGEDIKEFARIWKKEFKETLSPDEAYSEAMGLLDFCWELFKRRPEDEELDD